MFIALAKLFAILFVKISKIVPTVESTLSIEFLMNLNLVNIYECISLSAIMCLGHNANIICANIVRYNSQQWSIKLIQITAKYWLRQCKQKPIFINIVDSDQAWAAFFFCVAVA